MMITKKSSRGPHPFCVLWVYFAAVISSFLAIVIWQITTNIIQYLFIDSWLLYFVGAIGFIILPAYLTFAAVGFFRTGQAVRKAILESCLKSYWNSDQTADYNSFDKLKENRKSYCAWLKSIPTLWMIRFHLQALQQAITWSNGLITNEDAFRILQKDDPREAARVRYHEQFSNDFIGMLVLLPGVKGVLERLLVDKFQRKPTPLRVEAQIQPYVWGRPAPDSFIIRFLHRPLNQMQQNINIAELWLGAHKKNPAIVRIGKLSMDLDRFAAAAGAELVGKGRRVIGQLFKVLDAKEPLSLQMHERFKPDSKNESWMVVIDRERLKAEGRDQTIAEIYLGFRPIEEIEEEEIPGFREEYNKQRNEAEKKEYFRRRYEEALERGRTDREGREIKAFSNKIEVRWEKGEVEIYLNGKKQTAEVKKRLGVDKDKLVMNVPGATVHALSYGVIYELQETADKTLRLYDQGRNDPNRPLQIDEAIAKLDFTPRDPVEYLVEPVKLDDHTTNLIRTPLYAMDLICFEATGDEVFIDYPVKVGDSYQMLIVTAGEGVLHSQVIGGTAEYTMELMAGDTLIVPAALNGYRLVTRGRFSLLKVYEANLTEIKELQIRRGEKFWEAKDFFEIKESDGMEKEKNKNNILKFGTSGLRGLVTDMTDRECYINTKGYVEYLIETGQIRRGDTIAVAGDLRSSTNRIMEAVAIGIVDAGCKVENAGRVPSPALMFYAMQKGRASIMVTGSHIPDDRNGIKFNKPDGEVLKSDEGGILVAVAKVREAEYAKSNQESMFGEDGMFKAEVEKVLPEANQEAEEMFVKRYLDVFPHDALTGKKIVVEQHSAVGRDILVRILAGLGAEVIPEGRCEKFVPKDTENVTPETVENFRRLADQYHPFAIVSTDGDSDRPFVVDERGVFHRGDELGIVVAKYLEAEFAAVPVSSNDAVKTALDRIGIELQQTRIGSPYVIAAMHAAVESRKTKVVGWEVNGGFMLGTDFLLAGKRLQALPTRDAVIPILCALLDAIGKGSVSQLFRELPKRYTQAGLLDNFSVETSRQLIAGLKPPGPDIIQIDFEDETAKTYFSDGRIQKVKKSGKIEGDVDIRAFWKGETNSEREFIIKQVLESRYFTSELGYAAITRINIIDGIRLHFANNDVAHIRPSGNAPQLRIYSNADTQSRADEIVKQGLADDGILRKIEKDVKRYGL